MKTITPLELVKAYEELNPLECLTVTEDTLRIFGNWLSRYNADPSGALATANWGGKVTRALFRALGLKCPRTKGAMLEILEGRGKCPCSPELNGICPACQDGRGAAE